MINKAAESMFLNPRLQALAYESFCKTFDNWKLECPDEFISLFPDNFKISMLSLVLDNITVKTSNNPNYNYLFIAEYKVIYSTCDLQEHINNYILKFWDNYDVYDNVFWEPKSK